MGAELQAHAGVAQRERFLRQLGLVLSVHGHHGRAATGEEGRRRDPGSREADHDDVGCCVQVRHRSLSVMSVKVAKMKATIQKRMMICGSFQPTSSK